MSKKERMKIEMRKGLEWVQREDENKYTERMKISTQSG